MFFKGTAPPVGRPAGSIRDSLCSSLTPSPATKIVSVRSTPEGRNKKAESSPKQKKREKSTLKIKSKVSIKSVPRDKSKSEDKRAKAIPEVTEQTLKEKSKVNGEEIKQETRRKTKPTNNDINSVSEQSEREDDETQPVPAKPKHDNKETQTPTKEQKTWASPEEESTSKVKEKKSRTTLSKDKKLREKIEPEAASFHKSNFKRSKVRMSPAATRNSALALMAASLIIWSMGCYALAAFEIKMTTWD